MTSFSTLPPAKLGELWGPDLVVEPFVGKIVRNLDGTSAECNFLWLLRIGNVTKIYNQRRFSSQILNFGFQKRPFFLAVLWKSHRRSTRDIVQV